MVSPRHQDYCRERSQHFLIYLTMSWNGEKLKDRANCCGALLPMPSSRQRNSADGDMGHILYWAPQSTAWLRTELPST